MKKLFSLLVVLVLLPLAGFAAQINQCNYAMYNSAYTGIPNDFGWNNQVAVAATTVTSITLPVSRFPTGQYRTLVECPYATARFQTCHSTGTYNDCSANIGSSATITNGTASTPAPTCRLLEVVSGTVPTTTWLYSPTAQTVTLSYCYR